MPSGLAWPPWPSLLHSMGGPPEQQAVLASSLQLPAPQPTPFRPGHAFAGRCAFTAVGEDQLRTARAATCENGGFN